jgi:hypothetical protein
LELSKISRTISKKSRTLVEILEREVKIIEQRKDVLMAEKEEPEQPGMTIREYVAYRKSKGWSGSLGGVHYWLKKCVREDDLMTNDDGSINPEYADSLLPGPARKWYQDSMNIREYVEHRRRLGLPGSNRSVWERIRWGYIRLQPDRLIRASQADFIWSFYRCGIPCPKHLHDKWTYEVSDTTMMR